MRWVFKDKKIVTNTCFWCVLRKCFWKNSNDYCCTMEITDYFVPLNISYRQNTQSPVVFSDSSRML